ncbi:MAG: ribonuclease III [Candidatus Omnitrophica bacterium]|nr:ribonuclease III [Candidatus Omnitrophota bacterium]
MEKIKLRHSINKRFRRKGLLITALTHPSYSGSQNVSPESFLNFQRLEFLGDAILNLFIASELYRRFPKANEGLLSRMRSILVSKKLLAKIARSIELGVKLRLGKYQKNITASAREKILADVFEALLAALYFDRGRKTVEQFLLKRFVPYFDQKKLFLIDPNPKSSLQEFTQGRFGSLPVYQVQPYKNRKLFMAWVKIKGVRKAKGIGSTKQEAESQAAAAALKKLKIRKKLTYS